MSDKKIIISSNPSKSDDLLKRLKGAVSGRSVSTECNIHEIEKGYPKDAMIVICGSGRSSIGHAELFAQMKQNFEDAKIAMLDMGEAGMAGAGAGMALSNALKKLEPMILCPEDMMIMDPNVDFSGLEKIVLDSMTPIGPKPTKYNGAFYDESGPISKKAYKKLLKALDKKEKTSHKQDQTDRWCNKWDKKIKRKL